MQANERVKQPQNYQKEMDAYLAALSGAPQKTLLLQCCCAPCSSYVLEYLSPYFRILVYAYNPNIYPQQEYQKRVKELERLVKALPHQNEITIIPAAYYPEDYAAAATGLGLEPEGGARCTACFRLRLYAAAEQAAQMGADVFATTLTVSPHKNAQRINAIGEEAAGIYGVPYLCSDFKKRGGYQRSIVLSREYGLYRQNYCGCIYSLPTEE